MYVCEKQRNGELCQLASGEAGIAGLAKLAEENSHLPETGGQFAVAGGSTKWWVCRVRLVAHHPSSRIGALDEGAEPPVARLVVAFQCGLPVRRLAWCPGSGRQEHDLEYPCEGQIHGQDDKRKRSAA